MIFIHSNYRPNNCGGVEKVVSELISIAKKEVDKVICFYGDKENFLATSGNTSYIGRKILFKLQGAPFLYLGNFHFIRVARKSSLIIFQEPFPFLWPAILFLRIFYKSKIIVLVHANPVGSRFIMFLYSRIRSFVFKGAICVSTSPNLLSKVKSTQFNEHHCIPLSISIDKLSSKNLIDVNYPYVLYFGRMAKYKGITDLLKAATFLPDINFIIAGTGPLSDYTRNFINLNGIKNINFIDRIITESEKLNLIGGCKFMVFPSVSENEAFGLVQLEAMFYSKAIINTWLDSGVNFVAPNGVCAITVDKSNPSQLADAISLLWTDDKLTISLGANGFNRFEQNFSHSIFVNNWLNLIKNNYVKVCV